MKATGERNRIDAQEYTPAQRRLIRARLDKAEKGPYYGPFKNGAEVAAFLKNWVSKGKGAKLRKTA